jgi:MscS family membrane protein
MNVFIRFSKISLTVLMVIFGAMQMNYAEVSATAPQAAAVALEGGKTVVATEDHDCVTLFSECVINSLELDPALSVFDNPIWRNVFISIIIFIATMILAHPLTSLVFFLIRKISTTVKIESLHEVFKSLRMPLVCLFYVLGLHLISFLFFHDTKVGHIFHVILVEVTIVILIWGSVRLSDALMDNLQVYAVHRNNGSITGFLHLTKRILRITIITLGATVVMDNMGLKVGAFLTALGLGGAALALASKDVLSNFYGSIAILLDRPFSIGDTVNIGGNYGKVESIGLRSTNIRTTNNTVVSIPNGIVATSIIDNQAPQPNTLLTLSLAIAASTPKDMLPQVIEEFQEILKADKDVDASSVQVVFSKIQPYSLEIELYFGVSSKNPVFCRSVKERLNYKLLEALKAKSITLSYF